VNLALVAFGEANSPNKDSQLLGISSANSHQNMFRRRYSDRWRAADCARYRALGARRAV